MLLEDINHKLDALLEGQALLAPMSRKIDNVDARLIRIEDDMGIVTKVVHDHSRELDDHAKRITKLETIS